MLKSHFFQGNPDLEAAAEGSLRIMASMQSEAVRLIQTTLMTLPVRGTLARSARLGEWFLAELNAVVSWSRLEALIESHHLKIGKVARPPSGEPRMLRV